MVAILKVLLGSILGNRVLADSKLPTFDTEVVIIGGGMAGLAAAEALHKAGVSFKVLEADSRIGGRCKTESWAGLTIEKGANWIHGPWEKDDETEHNGLWQMKLDHGLKGSLTNYSDYKMLDRKGTRVSRELSQYWKHRTEEAMEQCEVDAEEQWEKAEEKELEVAEEVDYSVRTCLNRQDFLEPAKKDLEKDVANTCTWEKMAFEYTQRARKVSNMWAWPENGDFEDVDFFVTDPRGFCGPYFQSLEGRFAPGSVLLDQDVDRVKYSATSVEVSTKSATTIKAQFAISTIPLGVMQRGTVKFDPPFSAAKDAGIRGMKSGDYSKVYLKFPSNFWGSEEVILVTGNPVGWLTWAYNLDHPKLFPGSKVLNFHLAGEDAAKIDRADKQSAQDEIMATLRQTWPACPNPTDFYVSGWAANPLSWGAYSNWPLGYTENEWEEMRKPEGNLFFAGEHVDDFYGFLHGAGLSGISAAESVIAARAQGSAALNLSARIPVAGHSRHRRHFRFKGDPSTSGKVSGFLNKKSRRPVRRHL